MDTFERFRSVSRQYSEVNAVIENECTTTYFQLFSLTTEICKLLSTHSAKRVVILMQSGSTAYAAMFACLGYGCQYSPVDINSPEQRLHHICNIYQPDLILITENMPAPLPLPENITVVKLSRDKLLRNVSSSVHINRTSKPTDVAYTIFTSGSTGSPKGVVIPREGLNHYVGWAIKAIQTTPGERWSQHPNIGFDLSVLDIYGALCQGATLLPILSDADRMFPALFIRKHGINIWNSVPSVVGFMIKANQFTSEYVHTLRFVTFCGEPLPGTTIEKIFETLPNSIVQNTYGPTEATVSCTELRLTSNTYKQYIHGNCSLGSAIAGMKLTLEKDRNNQHSGEVILSGPQVALGYIGADEKNRERFFINDHGERCYRTGDIAQKNGDMLFFISRNDACLKINGRFVDLSGIEWKIEKLTGEKCCCFTHTNRIYAAIQTNTVLDIASLRKTLAAELLRHELPVKYLLCEKFPLNDNDKIDRKQLICLLES